MTLTGFILLLKRIPWQVHAALALVAAAWLLQGYHHREVARAEIAGFKRGGIVTAEVFRVAQVKADMLERIKVAQTIAQQAAINKEFSDALLNSHSDIDARATHLRLRHEAANRDRASRARNQSATGGTAPGTCPAASSDGLPWSDALPLMTQAAKDLAQLNAILDWEEAQQKLDEAERAAIADTPVK